MILRCEFRIRAGTYTFISISSQIIHPRYVVVASASSCTVSSGKQIKILHGGDELLHGV